MDIAFTVLMVASAAISGAVVLLNAIAPLTRTLKDDKVRDFLVFLHDKILAVILPFLAARATTNKENE